MYRRSAASLIKNILSLLGVYEPRTTIPNSKSFPIPDFRVYVGVRILSYNSISNAQWKLWIFLTYVLFSSERPLRYSFGLLSGIIVLWIWNRNWYVGQGEPRLQQHGGWRLWIPLVLLSLIRRMAFVCLPCNHQPKINSLRNLSKRHNRMCVPLQKRAIPRPHH